MYSTFQLAKKYIRYYRTAFNGKGHGMHSPFVFDFIQYVLNNKNGYEAPDAIETLRSELKQDKSVLQVADLGAGSRVQKSSAKTVSQIARSAVKPPKYSRLFYRLVKRYKPITIIELGTSLGITTAYLATAGSNALVHTIEGSDAIQARAYEHFKKLGLDNVISHVGNFDNILPQLLSTIEQVDLAYIDGNHRYEPTMRYFGQLLQKGHCNSVFVFDDIHWSAEMEKAWEAIKLHDAVTLSIDLFNIGLIFFKKDFRLKQHFTIRY